MNENESMMIRIIRREEAIEKREREKPRHKGGEKEKGGGGRGEVKKQLWMIVSVSE